MSLLILVLQPMKQLLIKHKFLIIIGFCIILGGAFFYWQFYSSSVAREQISSEYGEFIPAEKWKVLLVPGHDRYTYGTKYKDLREDQINLDLAEAIHDLLIKDGRFEVYTTRDFKTENYTDYFTSYFTSSESQIIRFMESSKQAMSQLLTTGTIEETEPILQHNEAAKETVFRLYAINKWANDNEIDLALHIHFNDYPRSDMTTPGKYRGFSIYVPERQFSNAETSLDLSQALYDRLSLVSATSTFPLEAQGILESQDLIATGANNSQTHPAVLIEYGYIYESDYYLKNRRLKILPILAKATFLGLLDYLK